jgi:beta-xylosidase
VLRRGLARRIVGAAAMVVLIPAVLTGCKPTTKAAYNGDFPDPSVIRIGLAYYAFGTQALGGHPAIQRLVSTDMKTWRVPSPADALLALPKWADGSGTWAPAVWQVGNRLVMYYSTHQSGGRHCLSVAVAYSPVQQFVDKSTKPLLCLPNGETIDPSPFVAAGGVRYLSWKGPSGSKGVATIYSQRLTPDGLSLVPGTRGTLLQAKRTGWTSYNIEAPSVFWWAGRYYLFYSGGNYWSDKYAIGYAVCRGPGGPCTDMSVKKPWFATHGNARGPGGESFFVDLEGHIRMAYHAWGKTLGYNNGGIRSMWIEQIAILGDAPAIIGPP